MHGQAWNGALADLPEVDLGQIETHIKLHHELAGDRDGLISLSRLFVGDRTGKVMSGLQTKLFRVGDTARMIRQAIKWAEERGSNIYIGNAILRPELMSGRGKDTDVIRVLALVLDSDADKGKVAQIQPSAPNYVVTTSTSKRGVNTQLYFVISEKDRSIENEAQRKLLQRIGAKLRLESGADAGGDLVRISRLAGTLNWPDEKKIGRGRVVETVRFSKADDGGSWSLARLAAECDIEIVGEKCKDDGCRDEPNIPPESKERSQSATAVNSGLSQRDTERIRRAASYVDWSDRSNGWLHWGMAIHWASGGSRQGYLLWTELSRSHCPEKFDPHDQQRVWDSFTQERDNGITLGTYFHAVAKGARNALDKVLKQAKSDPGAPFAQEAINAATVLRDSDKAEFVRFRAALKKMPGIKITVWDSELGGGDPQSGSEDKKNADLLIEMAREVCQFFHDEDREPYAVFDVDGHQEVWPLKSSGFSEWLSFAFHKKYDRAPSETALKTAVPTLIGDAKFSGGKRAVHLRVARHDGAYWLDLCDDRWRAVRIDKTGWQIIDKPPVMFMRTPSMRALPEPQLDGNLEDLWTFVNIPEPARGLVLAWLVECLRPETPYVVLALFGEHGSAKSTAQRYLRDMIDPNDANLRSAPKTREDIQIAACNSHLVSYENLSHLPPDHQDAFCVLATGGGFGKRTLFKDTEETVRRIKRPVILNGIAVVVTAPDLQDRAILIEMPMVQERKTSKMLDSAFEEKRPYIIGALLDLFSRSLNCIAKVESEMEELPRMADFSVLGEAVYDALGRPPGSFLKGYNANRHAAIERSIDASAVASAILAALSEKDHIAGTIGELRERLRPEGVADEFWPRSAKGFADHVRRIAPTLRSFGISITISSNRSKRGFECTITRVRG